MSDTPTPEPLSPDDVRKVAVLSRLELSDKQIAEQRDGLTAVLGYVQRLQAVDTEGVEPMANPAGETNRLDEDIPVPGLPTDALMKMAPATHAPYVTTPKATGDGGGA